MNLKPSLSKLFSTEANVFRAFAEQYDLVYFGRLHQEDDDQRIVRGITVSRQHVDNHYCVGTVQGYDIVLLKRTDKLEQANTSHTEKYDWVLMQIDLHTDYDHPHVFIDGKHHNELFYQTMFVKFARLMKVDKSLFGDENTAFVQRFSAYTPPDSLDELPQIVTATVGDTMAAHFAHLDFEWFQDRLIVYSTGGMPTKHLLEHMLRAGLWLADILDNFAKQKISAPSGADIPSWRRD